VLEAELLGRGDSQPEAVNLRRALAERAMPPRHALDVLTAFRMDVTKLRYETWDEVIHYCRYSAMPVGRFMLDVHGESTSTWAASDALCAGLQIFVSYARYAPILKWMTLSLFAYFATLLVVKLDWLELARGVFLPSFSSDPEFWTTVVAVLGTTISPYLFFCHRYFI